MLVRIHVSTPHRIVVDVNHLLPQHIISLNQLRMSAFLPDLVLAVMFVGLPAIPELMQQPVLIGACRAVDK